MYEVLSNFFFKGWGKLSDCSPCVLKNGLNLDHSLDMVWESLLLGPDKVVKYSGLKRH